MDTLLFLIFFTLAAATVANAGYNYQQTNPIGNQFFRPSAQFSNNVAAALAPPSIYEYIPPANIATVPSSQYLQAQGTAPSQFFTQPSLYFPPFQQPPVYTPSDPSVSVPQNGEQQQQRAIISSNIYIHSAPEETEELFVDQGTDAVPIRKNYHVIFVKAPTHNLKFNLNSIKQAQAAYEEKTVIYVLSKKPDISNFQSQLLAVQTEPKTHKPEVYFIKYKTQDEANRAQQEIQAQYDALGGSTTISDEGFAPITSVISGGDINSGSSFLDSASSNQQHFIQPPFQGNQGSAAGLSIGVTAPNLRYLPVKK